MAGALRSSVEIGGRCKLDAELEWFERVTTKLLELGLNFRWYLALMASGCWDSLQEEL